MDDLIRAGALLINDDEEDEGFSKDLGDDESDEALLPEDSSIDTEEYSWQ